jgi:hypothetical protein
MKRLRKVDVTQTAKLAIEQNETGTIALRTA